MNNKLIYFLLASFVAGGLFGSAVYYLASNSKVAISNTSNISRRPHSEEPYIIEDPYVKPPDLPKYVEPEPEPTTPKEPKPIDLNSDLIYKTPVKIENEFQKYIKKTTAQEDVDLAFVTSAYLGSEFQEEDENGDIFATYHIRYPKSFANVDGGLPCVLSPDVRPLVGSVFKLHWLTEFIPSYPEGGADGYTTGPNGFWKTPHIRTLQPAVRPNKNCALFVSIKKPVPAPIPGGKGAILQCPPNYVFAPERVELLSSSITPGKFVQFEQDYQGKIQIFFRCLPIMKGLTLYCQLVVADNRVDAGFIPTPMVEINIGNK